MAISPVPTRFRRRRIASGIHVESPSFVILALLLALPLTLAAPLPGRAQSLPTPEEHLGFPVGADNHLAHWDQILEYMHLADAASDRITVQILGQSTLGRDFPLVIVTSEANMADLDRIREINRRLYDPDSITSEAEAERLIAEGKVIVAVTLAIHASEIGSTQMVLEAVHRLATEQSPYIRNILDNTVLLLFPCLNPDGQAMEVEWFNETFGTEYEGARLPRLYHHYVGHDTNRDAYMFSQVETRLLGRVLYHEWFPEVWLDEHQMGNRGARIFIMPAAGPPNPNVDPWIYRTAGLLGFTQAQALDEAGKPGAIYGETYTYWWQGAMGWTGWWHNMVGMLSELASVNNLASPVETPVGEVQLRPGEGRESGGGYSRTAGGSPPRDRYPRVNYLNPWLGGRWTLRDIVDYELIITFATLDACADMRENMLSGIREVNRRTVEKGRLGDPWAILIPDDQHDDPTVAKFISILRMGGVEIERATAPFTAGGTDWPAGTCVIPMAQVFRNYAKDLLEPQVYPSTDAPYDAAGWSLGMQMGVETVFIAEAFTYSGEAIGDAPPRSWGIFGEGNTFLLDARANDSFTAALRLMRAGHSLGRTTEPVTVGDEILPAGTFVLSGSRARADVEAAARDLGLIVHATGRIRPGLRLDHAPRVGLYQAWGGNMEEGWTRYVLDTFGFEPVSIHPEDIRDHTDLGESYDAIIFAGDRVRTVLSGQTSERTPPQYRGGIEESGVAALQEFVRGGGTVILLGGATDIAAEWYDLSLTNALRGVSRDEFFCPGSILEVEVDPGIPMAWGMPGTACVMFANDQVFAADESAIGAGTRVALRFGDADPLRSGWLRGPEHLFGGVGAASVPFGEGQLILLPLRVQRRSQTHGTFKLLFNPLMNSAGR